ESYMRSLECLPPELCVDDNQISGRSLSRLLTLDLIKQVVNPRKWVSILHSGNPGKSSRKTSWNSRTIGTSSSRVSFNLSSAFLDVTCASGGIHGFDESGVQTVSR
nr:hypothetical protein [Tanacetum cinerariifolium]